MRRRRETSDRETFERGTRAARLPEVDSCSLLSLSFLSTRSRERGYRRLSRRSFTAGKRETDGDRLFPPNGTATPYNSPPLSTLLLPPKAGTTDREARKGEGGGQTVRGTTTILGLYGRHCALGY